MNCPLTRQSIENCRHHFNIYKYLVSNKYGSHKRLIIAPSQEISDKIVAGMIDQNTFTFIILTDVRQL